MYILFTSKMHDRCLRPSTKPGTPNFERFAFVCAKPWQKLSGALTFGSGLRIRRILIFPSPRQTFINMALDSQFIGKALKK